MRRIAPIVFLWWFTVTGISATALGPSTYNPINHEVTTGFEAGPRHKRTDPLLPHTRVVLGPYDTMSDCLATLTQMTHIALITVTSCTEVKP